MKTKFKLMTWDFEEGCIFSKDFKNENEAIQMAQALGNRRSCPHNVIKIFRVKKTGHKWELEVLDADRPRKTEYVSFYSKKDAVNAIKVIREYDDTLKTSLIKIY
jgi:hypothetical protein